MKMMSTGKFRPFDGYLNYPLKLIKTENSKAKPLDFITPLYQGDFEFGSNGDAHWLYNQYLLVNIRFNAVLGDLIEIFKIS